ncbi:unnamed protein product [Moneuplotes crassus]|uniref:Uncharacterized protein n=1 Tax=Euplotes crassus TaxID=5936 RepID=A0AAD1UAL1_EUPCR|nr:unnamed protein product [Moneuplotes crassus]
MEEVACGNRLKDVVEKCIMTTSRKVEIRLATSHYFNCFKEELYQEVDPDRDIGNRILDVYANHDYQKELNFTKREIFNSSFKANQVYVRNIKNVKNILGFLELSFSQSTNVFYVHASQRKFLNMASCLNAFTRISWRVLKGMFICWFKISAPQLQKIIASYRHVEDLGICYCKLSLSVVMNFTEALKNFNIKTLSFSYSGRYDYSDWKSNPEELVNLIKGLATSSDLISSLEHFDISYCGISIDKAKRILEENSFGKIQLTLI